MTSRKSQYKASVVFNVFSFVDFADFVRFLQLGLISSAVNFALRNFKTILKLVKKLRHVLF